MLDGFVHKNEKVAAALHENFLIMKVNYGSKNRNEAFLKQFPKIPAYPHYLVLDSNGKFLHSQGTGELEEKKSYNEKVFLAFLRQWQRSRKVPVADKGATPRSLDAEKVLAAALVRARSEKKKVLIHLGAPT